MSKNWHTGFITAMVLMAISTSLLAQKNILIHQEADQAYAPCEPSIAIDPKNTDRMVAGSVLNNVYHSKDGGLSWEKDELTSSLGVYGDPCIIADDKHRFYYFHLSNPSGEGWANDDILDRIVCQRSSKNLKKWSDGSGIGLNASKDQDKEWAAWDPINKRLVVTWTQFDKYGDTNPSCRSNILLSTSKNGKTWTQPITISSTSGDCIDESETAEGAVPAIDNEGNILVSWSLNGKLFFNKIRFENPTSYEAKECIIVDKGADWAFDIPGIGRANGMPITAYDKNSGNIYVNWADQRNGANDTDIWMIKSTDGGTTWSERIRVNDDAPGKHQFFTWMTVDQSSGYIYCVFYDRRNHTGTKTDVYLAISKDGGLTFENRKISESSFDPSKDVFFGDYNNISAVNGVVRPIWTRNDNGKLSIWTAIVNE
jgi:photosystem II stability/assembly factor-like uncharacterized protein